MHPDPFYVQDYEKNNGPGTSYQSLLDYKNYLEKSIFSGICHHSNFDSFWKKGFWVISNIKFAKFCKSIVDKLLNSVSAGLLN